MIPLPRRLAHATVAALVAAGSLAFLSAPTTLRAQDAAARADQPATSADFLRFERDPTGGGTLQTSIVRYANDEGDVVDLIGAVHVGDRAYYELLNERFKQYDSLLYEMVKPKDVDMADRQAGGGSGGGLNLIHTLQKAMQTVLELSYQLDDVDYAAENFVHADMDLETFTRRQSEAGEGFLDMMIKQMLNDMTNPEKAMANQGPSMFEIMDALGAPDRARRLKLIFAEQLSNVEDLMQQLTGGEPSVILDERNEAAFEVLDRRLDAGEDSLGVFYGAAHLKGMDDLLRERGFRRVGEPEWLTAWDMTLDGSGKAEMRERMRKAIVAEAVDQGQVGEADDRPTGDAAAMESIRRELRSMRAEGEALRKENEALREQVQVLREQNAALREQAGR